MVLLSYSSAQTQTKTFENEVFKISKKIELITQQQKDSLKAKVIDIDKKLEKKEISADEADAQKKEAATYHAKRIEELVSQQEVLLQLLVQDKTNGKIASSDSLQLDDDFETFTIGNKRFKFNISTNDNEDHQNIFRRKRKSKFNKRTTTEFVFAIGINNVLTNNQLVSLENSDYNLWQSRFYELGFDWKTRFSKEPSQLYFKYGFSFLWNNLRAENNQYHFKNGGNTTLQTNANPLSESRLRHVQLNFPMHIEWDLSKTKTYEDGREKDRTNESFKFGIGGFVGFKLGTRQYLNYTNAQNVKVEEIQFDNFNMNTFNYGISTYVGYKFTSLYVKYDLNPLFTNTEIRNISMGIRLDLD